jgi:hypothetical protein
MIFLGVAAAARLGGRVTLAELVTQTWSFDLSSYPRWLVVLGGSLALALGIWVVMKLLKLALWVMFFTVLIGGTGWALWLLFQ